MHPCELEHFHPLDFPYILVTILAHQATGFTVRSRCLHFYVFFPLLLVLSLLVDAGCCVGTTASCGKDVGDGGVAELEDPVHEPGTTIGT